MAIYVKGNAVEHATSYELFEKIGGTNNIYSSDGEVSGYVLSSGGEPSAKSTCKYNETYFPCVAGQYLSFKGNNVADAVYDGVQNACFYDAEKNFIKRTNFENLGVQNLLIDAENCAYVRFSMGINAADIIIIQSDIATAYTDETFPTETEGDQYISLGTSTALSFNVSNLGLAAGDHTLVVKAKADGYETSDYSNEVVYTVT